MKSKKEYKKKRRRVGRGSGSGAGKTCGRGHKGQHSRSGAGKSPGFEGGQMTYVRRLPKRGFSNARFAEDVEIVNLKDLSILSVSEVTPTVLASSGIIDKKFKTLKVLGSGKLEKALTVHAHAFSESAQKKIEAAGGKVIVLTTK